MGSQSAVPPLTKPPGEQATTIIASLILLIPMLEAAVIELQKNKRIKREVKKELLRSLQTALINAKKTVGLPKDELIAREPSANNL